MKQLISNYAFSASDKTITFLDLLFVDLRRVLIITNVTDQIIIYNFADTTKGGTTAGNILTLEYDTTTMSDTDVLQIYYDVVETPISEEDYLFSILVELKEINLKLT